MTTKQIEVCAYYKGLHPGALILFHIPGRYMVMGEDVKIVAKSIQTTVHLSPDVAYIPDNIQLLSELGSDGMEICLIEYRNDKGVLDFPDLERIKAEKEMDY